MIDDKWHLRYLRIAREVSTWSKDPSTQVGCLVMKPNRRPVTFSYNGLPKALDDDPELLINREWKYEHIIHAEMNAMINANLEDTYIYVYPFLCCPRCAVHVAEVKPRMVITTDNYPERWKSDLDKSKRIFDKASIPYLEFPVSHLDTKADVHGTVAEHVRSVNQSCGTATDGLHRISVRPKIPGLLHRISEFTDRMQSRLPFLSPNRNKTN